ncbi:hypothetical protein BV394_06020 [Brevirhabdus pacifica]|uniref:Uncharacterized protein n=1 Tax=Brevirhabdus pacifica TaxID=1267768 RepID=A0A1U7DH57_9RHOB|nr:TerB family tellurite resistance protein [Brevirhabdus pacifica]APX89327.1 hypothetical protein BV394_06020 [Brevirhabdus pacifica]OWU76646.1 hypothetical protein ATO5_10265 [Loktanella sp. 22II-4b]PJJ86050.1 putative tellurite resistance protein B-like protein [Brevirhabdus pacifica]
MFADLLSRLAGSGDRPLPRPDARLALAALLVRIARSDGQYDTAEVERIGRILAERYGLSDAEAAELRTQAECLEAEAPDTVRFTREIKDHVQLEDRAAVIEALWDVVLADGTRDHEEDALLRLVVNLLGISDRDSAIARQKVQSRLDG